MSMHGNQAEILDLIKQDHDQVKELFQRFEETYESDRQQASEIAQQIISDLTTHSELEEELVYPSLKQQDERLFYEAREEHHVAEVLLEELEEMSIEDPSFTAKMMVLRENVTTHIEEEESQVFQKLSELPEDTLRDMSQAWRSRKAAVT